MNVENLGPIKEAQVDFSALTILCGMNNQGKTYLSYTLYGILSHISKLTRNFLSDNEYENLIQKGKLTLDKGTFSYKIKEAIHKNFVANRKEILKKVFKTDDSNFAKSKISISDSEIINFLNLDNLDSSVLRVASTEIMLEAEDDVYTILISTRDKDKETIEDKLTTKRLKSFIDFLISKVIDEAHTYFYVPSERIGINVFKSQLNHNKIELLDFISNTINSANKSPDALEASIVENLTRITNVYPLPIADYLNYINGIKKYDIDDTNNEISYFIRNNIIKGRYVVDHDTSNSYFRSKAGKNRYKSDLIPLDITSSSVKSIYGLDYFFENIDEDKLNVIIIDEPEMNLHPANQVEIANLFNLIVSKGIKVVISTHSDFLVKKIQNIILRNEINKDLQGLHSNNVSVYNFENNTINKIDLMNDREPFKNFENTIAEVEDEYLDLLDMKSAKDNGDLDGSQ